MCNTVLLRYVVLVSLSLPNGLCCGTLNMLMYSNFTEEPEIISLFSGPKPMGADIWTMNSSVFTKSLEMASSRDESSSIAPALILFSKSGSHPKHPARTPPPPTSTLST